MPIHHLVQNPKTFIETELSSEQLEILCGINCTKTKPKKDPADADEYILSADDFAVAIEFQYYALVELISRLEHGFHNTATDKWEAAAYRAKAKTLRLLGLAHKAGLTGLSQSSYENAHKKLWGDPSDPALKPFLTHEKLKELKLDALESPDYWFLEHHPVIDDIENPTNPLKNTTGIKSSLPFKTSMRLQASRANRLSETVASNISKAKVNKGKFLPWWFKYLVVESAIDLFAHLFTILYTMIKGQRQPKYMPFENKPLGKVDQTAQDLNNRAAELNWWQRFLNWWKQTFSHQNTADSKGVNYTHPIVQELNEKAAKVTRWERFKAVGFKGSRPSQIANALLSLGFNLTTLTLGILFLATAPISLPVLTFITTIGILVGVLTFSGTISDLLVDMFGSAYELFNLHSLIGKLDEKKSENAFLNKNIVNYFNEDLALKREESLASRFLRTLGTNFTLSAGIFLFLFPPTAFAGAILLGTCAFYMILADVIPSWRSANTLSNIDKTRSLIAAIALVAATGLAIALCFVAIPYITIPTIGAGVVLVVGATALGRRLARADWGWVKEKIENLGQRIANVFKNVSSFIFGVRPDLTLEDDNITAADLLPMQATAAPIPIPMRPPFATGKKTEAKDNEDKDLTSASTPQKIKRPLSMVFEEFSARINLRSSTPKDTGLTLSSSLEISPPTSPDIRFLESKSKTVDNVKISSQASPTTLGVFSDSERGRPRSPSTGATPINSAPIVAPVVALTPTPIQSNGTDDRLSSSPKRNFTLSSTIK